MVTDLVQIYINYFNLLSSQNSCLDKNDFLISKFQTEIFKSKAL